MYKTFFNSESNISFVGMTNNLIKAVENTNTAIGLAQNFGSILNVFAARKHMGMLVAKLNNELPKREEVTKDDGSKRTETKFDENLAWVLDYKNLATKLSDDKDENGYAMTLKKMGEHNYTTSGLADKINAIFKIEEVKPETTEGIDETTNGANVADSTTPKVYKFSGYLYSDVQLELIKLVRWFASHTKDKLEPTLNKIINLIQRKLSPILSIQMNKIMEDLAKIYYNEVTKIN